MLKILKRYTNDLGQGFAKAAANLRDLLTWLSGVVLVLSFHTTASATTFTETVPNGNGSIPSTYPPVGGTLFTFIGANGNIYYQFVNPSTQFEGFSNSGTPVAFQGNPFQLGPSQTLNCGPTACTDYFGGAIVEGYARLTARDGDACANEFDENDVFFEVNGIRVGSFTGPTTETTNRDGTVSIGFGTCFPNQGTTQTSTAWFDLTSVPGLLDDIFTVGSTTPYVADNDPSDNRWFFRDGDDATGSPEVAPGVSIVKTADKTSYAVVNEVINYSFFVENIGSVTLTNVQVTDPFITGAVSCPQTTLASGANMTCSATHTVTQANIDDDVVFVNQATVTGTPTEGTLGSVSGTITIPGPAEVNNLTITKTASKDTNVEVGDVITYTYVVTSTGNITIDDLNVTDSHGGAGTLGPITPVDATIAPNGGTQSFTADYTVTQQDIDNGGVISNTATVNGTPRRGTVAPASAVEDISVIAPLSSSNFVKTATPDSGAALGDTVTYNYAVENTGNVSLLNVAISDVHNAAGSLSAITPAQVASLPPGQTANFTASYVITQADIDAGTVISNTATANATPAGGSYTPPTATEDVSVEAPAPAADFVKTASDTTNVNAGDVITYTYSVENTGNVTLTDLSVSDNHMGAGTLGAITPASIASLPVGQIASFTANYTVTLADIESGADITNEATLTATPAGGTLPPATAQESVDVADPASSLSMVKTALSADFGAVGDVVDYEYVVTNTGNVSVSAVSVSDDKIASVSCPAGALAPTESVTCTASYTVVQADLDAGFVTNNAQATAAPVLGTAPTAPASETVDANQLPELTLAKTATDSDFSQIGDTIGYEYLVTNTGNVEISNISVSDDKIASVSCPAGALAPGEFLTCTASYSVTQADLDAGQVVNNASAAGTPAGGTLAPAGAQETVGGTQSPALGLVKNALDTSYAAIGDMLDYEYVVTNTGNVTLTQPVTVVDDKIAVPQIVSCPSLPAGGLMVGASLTCSATYSVTQADLDAGSVTNVAQASSGAASSPNASETVNASQLPAMTLLKDAVETEFSAVGDQISYNYTVTNTGNVYIANLSVTDDLIASIACGVSSVGNGDSHLDPGETVVCTGIYSVTQEDLNAGSVTNNASASGTPAGGSLTPPTAAETVDAAQQPALSLTKTANENSYDSVGDVINYEYVVLNTGNVFISNIAVTDDKIAAVSCDVTAVGNNDANLDPGESVTCTASYSVLQADLDAGEVINNASVTGAPAGGTLAPAPAQATVSADQQPMLTTVKTATVVNFELPGDIVSYEYVVTNSGNVTFTDAVTVNDNLISSVSCPALPAGGLAPNASVTCTADYTVTQADLDAGSVTNLASATSGTTSSLQTSETIPADQNPSLEIEKMALFTDFTAAGEVVNYEYIVRNTGNLTLTGGVDVVDDKIGTINCATGNLVPGAQQSCQASYTITQADMDAGEIANQAYGQNGSIVSAPVDVTVTGTASPSLGFTKSSPTASFTMAGDVVEYVFDVENTGNVTLSNVAITDDIIASISCPNTVLAPSETMQCTASYSVTQADVDAGQVVNNASVGGNPPSGPAVSTPGSATVDGMGQPGLSFDKRAIDSDFINVGDVLDFEFDVENTGDVTLSNVAVTDDLIAAVNCPLTTLAPSQTMTCTASYAVTQADIDAGAVTNNAAADAQLPGGNPAPQVLDSVTVDGSQNPAMSVVKSALNTDYAAVGDVLDYSYLVRNTGNVSITNIVVSDDLIAAVSCPLTALAPAQETTCTASYSVTQADIDSGSVTNNVSVTGAPAGGTLSPAADQVTVSGTQNPAMTIAKSALTADFANVGDTIEYQYVVTNTGNTTLTDPITVSDDKIASVSCPALPAGGLAIGETLTCTASYSALQADLDAGFVTNIASASDGTTTSPDGTATVNAVQTPSMSVSKTADLSSFTSVGQTITYSYEVTNTGNVTLTSAISVTDDRIASVSCPALPAGGLVPGAALSCTGTDTVTQADLDAGSITNTASASDGTSTSAPVSETVTADQMPALTIAKAAQTPSFAAVGDMIDYNYTVTNSGNVTITSPVTVSDDKIASVSCPALPGGALAPAQSLVCTASYSATQADIDAGFVTNVASASAGGATSPSVSETVDADQLPAMSVTKLALDSSFAAPGDTIDYSYVVRNTGNTTLTGGVSVTDDKIPAVVCPSLPAGGLAPNGELTCTASYVVTQADVDAGQVTNIASASNGAVTSPEDTARVDADQMPSLQVVKRGVQSSYNAVGDVLNYEYDVINDGNITITNAISVSDDKIPSVSCPALPAGGLPPMGQILCMGSYTVTQADLDAGGVTNIASATDGTVTSPTAALSIPATLMPEMDVEKNAVAVNFEMPGDIASYEYIVTNTGNVTLTQPITINDNLIPSSDINCPALPANGLAPAASIVCTGNYTVTQDNLDLGSVTNVASATDGTTTSGLTSATIPANQTPALVIRKSSADTSYSNVGDVLNYSYEIENTGNLTLTGVVEVSDNKIGRFDCFTGNLMSSAPGNIQSCTASYTVTQADIDAGEVTNDAFAEHPRASSAPDSVTISATQTPELTLVKTALTADYAAVGDELDYSFSVQNTGNTTIVLPISISDSRIPDVVCPPLPSGGLAPGASLTCTGTDTVTQADIDAGSVTNTAIASDGDVTSAPQSESVNAVQTPELSLDKIANDNDFTAVGDVLDYTFIVTNTGNISITAPVSVSDSRIGTVTCPALPSGGLQPNQTLTCTASDLVTQADIDAGSVENTASASDGTTTSAPKTVSVTGSQLPALTTEKSADQTSFAAVGDVLSYSYVVTNSGNVTLTSAVSVSDDKIASVSCPALPAGGLVPAASIECSASYAVTQADIDAGFVTNIASATDGTTSSPDVSATVNAAQAPALETVKTALTTEFAAVGDTLDYEYVVTNTGNTSFTEPVVITDDRIASVSCPALPSGGLTPGASVTCTATDIVTQADIDLGTVTNTASAASGETASAPVSETVIGNQTNTLTIEKQALTSSFAQAGDVLSYSYAVRNAGNVTITNPVTVSDDKIASVSCPALPAAGLAPGGLLTCMADYEVTQADIDAGSVTNVAFASSGGQNSAPDEVTVQGAQAPALSVEKSTQAVSFSEVGEIITYSYAVTNSGNVTLTEAVSVTDDKIAQINCPALAASGLTAGASLTCTADYAVTQADLDAGAVTNIAFATSGEIVSPVDTVTVEAEQTAGLRIEKSALSEGFNMAGDIVSYEYVITNTGNTTLTQAVTVSDDKIATVNCPALPEAGLPPQATLSCAADYEVTQADIDAGFVTNIASASSGDTTSPEDSVTVNAMAMPALSLSKTIVETLQVGGPIYDVTYQIVAENTGNVTLTGLQIQDNLASFLAPATIYEAPSLAVSSISGASANAGFDGAGDVNLLAGAPTLAVGETGMATIIVRIDTTNGGPAQGNTAIATSPELPADVSSNDPTITPSDDSDVNPTPLSIIDTDGDGVADGFESTSADRDGDGIVDSEDYDPTGYFYCEENGQILSGGGITINGPRGSNSSVGSANDIIIVQDGSEGFYQFFVTAPGRYTLTPRYPDAGVPSTDRPVQSTALDVTSLLPSNPAVLGSSENGNSGDLADSSLAANERFFFEFDIEAGDPSVFMNNIPLKHCGTPQIALSKSPLGEPEPQEDGSQLISYALTATNTGETLIQNIQITDDMDAVFGAGQMNNSRLELGDKPDDFAGDINPSFDGVVDTNLLLATGDLRVGESVTVHMFARVTPTQESDFVNTATVTGEEPREGGVLSAEDSATLRLVPASNASLLRVTKTARPRTVQIGDPVLYTISVTNESSSAMTGLNIVDQLPEGFAYVPNSSIVADSSTRLNIEPSVISRGVLSWDMNGANAAPLDSLAPNETLAVTLRLLAGPNVEFGAHENQAFVESPSTSTRSEIATAIVDYIPEPSFDCTPVIGRVYDDVNHNGYPDDGEPGLPAVRLVTVNGDIITTDEFGRYHIPCAVIADSERGSNFLLKADTRTLPLGYKPTSENPRVVRATRGKFVKMNFGAAFRPKLRFDLSAADFEGSPYNLSRAAMTRFASVLTQAPEAERALLVYNADKSVDVDTAQISLQTALKALRQAAPNNLGDIALEANWGEPANYDMEEVRVAAEAFTHSMGGKALKDNGRADGGDRVVFTESQNGRIVPTDRDEIRDRHEDNVWNNSAGLRGARGSEALSGDNRAASNGLLGRRDNAVDTDSKRPGRLMRWIGWGNKTSAYADGPEIETTTDSLDVVKRLNAQANVVSSAGGRVIRAEGYWNYGAFITRAELRLFDAKRSVRGRPLAIAPFTQGTAQLPLSAAVPEQLSYVLRVYGADGAFDETAPKLLTIGDAGYDLSEADWAAEASTAYGQNTLAGAKITVRGGAVRVYGRNVDQRSVTVMGTHVVVDENGRFVAEQILPAGMQRIEILAGGNRILRTVDVQSRGTFYVAQIEATIGEHIGNGSDGVDSFEEGRLAFYVRSRLNDRWSLTATADTGEAAISDLLSGLDDKNLDQLLRRLDPDRYYPTFGDNGTIEQDAPTSGRVYARLERDDDYLLWGNYQTNFNDTEYARVQRTLYGAKLHWDENGNPTKFGDDRTRLTAFAASGGTLQGRDELRGTSGSIYYLRHGDISIGSEILRVETRDSVSGLVLQSRRLVYGQDYDLDFIQGRVILNQPLASSEDDGRLFRDGSNSGNETVLIADYEYSPVLGNDQDASVYGLRGSRWLGDKVKLGVSYNHDTDGGAESDLYGADLTLQHAAGTYIKGEVSRSEGQGVETFRSIDGGFTYNPLPRGGLAGNDSAMAYAVEAAADFSEIKGLKLRGSSQAYWRKREAGFAGYGATTNQMVEQFGGRVDLSLSKNLQVSGRADVSDDQTLGTNSFAEASLSYDANGKLSGSIGASYNDDARGNSGTSVGARLDYNFDEDNKIYAFGQFGVQGDNTRTTDRIGAGAEFRLSQKLYAGGEISTGEDGLGARATARYQYEDGDEFYLAYDLPLSGQAASSYGTFNLGARRRYGDALSVYGEERFQFNERGLNGVTHAYGIDFKPGNWTFGGAGEIGRVDNLDRTALSATIGYGSERLKAGLSGEWREDENVDTGDLRSTVLMRATAQYQASEELRLQAKINHAFSDQTRDDALLGPQDFNEAEFTEASLAAAFRPIWDDRLNILAKLVYLEDLSPSSQRFNGEAINYRQKSEIISVDGSYDVSARWTLGAKYAHRSGSVTSSRESLDFTRSSADLWVGRIDYHLTHHWDALAELRHLDIGDGTISRTGGLMGIYRHLNDNAKIGVGLTYGGIEEEYLAAIDESDDWGWYLNVVGKF